MTVGTHNVLRLILKSGESLALDISGAQHGWREPIAPWDKWCRHRALHVNYANRTPASDACENMQRMFASPDQIHSEDLRHDMATAMMRLLDQEAAQRGLDPPRKLLGLSPTDFGSCERAVVQQAQQACLTWDVRPVLSKYHLGLCQKGYTRVH